MKIGVDYYPEQWDKSLWKKDAEMMSQIGVKIVRIADYAWTNLEPEEGEFNFTWLDEIIAIFSKYGISIVLCIPTNCPPKWMFDSCPEILRTDNNGKNFHESLSARHCVNSPLFVNYAKRLTSEMARRYANNQFVIVWQIDNSPLINYCCCEDCKEEFRIWLAEKYDNIENINNAFGNSLGTNKYKSLTEILPPSEMNNEWQNPALALEYKRFMSDSMAKFLKTISQIIIKESPKAQITTSISFADNMPDFYKIFNDMSFASCNNYPTVKLSDNPDEFYSNAFYLDFIRGIKENRFWVMEQLSGVTENNGAMTLSPLPNMIKGYALQAILHGAYAVLHYRWRTPISGAKMNYHGILDQSNTPGRRFFEFSELCKTVSKLNVLRSTYMLSDIAILYSPDSDWAFGIQPQSEGFDYVEQLKYFHAAFMSYGANVDIVSPETDLSDYKLVIAPSLYVNNKPVTENIYRYVINGGTLVMTNRSGVKDTNNNGIMDTLPTVFKELIGAEITEYDPIGSDNRTIVDFNGNEFKCRQWCDILKLNTAKAYAEYNESFYICCPAITMNKYCGGIAYYVGTICSMDFYQNFAKNLMKQTGIPRLKGLPRGVEVTTRTNGIDNYICFFNNSDKDAVIGLPKAMYSIVDSTGKEKIELKPFEMEIVRR